MRIVYFGSGAFGLPTLEALARAHEIAGVVTQPDRPSGRGRQPTPTPVGQWADRNVGGPSLLRVQDVNAPDAIVQIRALAADAWVVIAFGQKLSPALLDGPFALNLHGSLLPRWRGAAPINHALLAGDATVGVTAITLAERMDAGLMLGAASTPARPAETAGELHDRLAALGPELVLRVLEEQSAAPGFSTPGFVPHGQRQNETEATRAPKLSRADGWVNFEQPAELCRRRINGLSPWPGVTVALRGERLRLLRAETGSGPAEQGAGADAPAGAVVAPDRGLVLCGEGSILRLLEVQLAGGRAMRWAEFANGRRIAPGETLSGGAPSAS